MDATTAPNGDGQGGMTDGMTDTTAEITVAMIGQDGRPGLGGMR
jgi:hypothetical protein